jgi:hypothetical protein
MQHMSETTTTTPTPAVSVDFTKIGQTTLQALNTGALGTASTTAVSPQHGATELTTTPVTPVLNATTPETVLPSAAPSDTTAPSTYEIDFGNGQRETVTAQQLDEWRKSGLRLSDYTKKTTEVAQQRRELEALAQQIAPLQEDIKLVQQLRQNPELIVQLAQQYTQQQQPQTTPAMASTPAGFDPNAPMTMGQTVQMAEAIAQRLQQVEQGLTQTVEQRAAELVQQQLKVANYTTEVNQTINSVYDKHPVLKAMPETDDILRYRVMQMAPRTLAEAKFAFQQVGEAMAQELLQSIPQQSVTFTQPPALTQGTEPPRAGHAPSLTGPTTASYVRDGGRGLDWSKMKTDAVAIINSLS